MKNVLKKSKCNPNADLLDVYSPSSSSSNAVASGSGFTCKGLILPTFFPVPPEQSIHFPPNNLHIGRISDSGSITKIFVPFSHSLSIIFLARNDLPEPLEPSITIFEFVLSLPLKNGEKAIILPSSSVPR